MSLGLHTPSKPPVSSLLQVPAHSCPLCVGGGGREPVLRGRVFTQLCWLSGVCFLQDGSQALGPPGGEGFVTHSPQHPMAVCKMDGAVRLGQLWGQRLRSARRGRAQERRCGWAASAAGGSRRNRHMGACRGGAPLVTVPGHLGTPRLLQEDAKGRWGPRCRSHQEPRWEPCSGKSLVFSVLGRGLGASLVTGLKEGGPALGAQEPPRAAPGRRLPGTAGSTSCGTRAQESG